MATPLPPLPAKGSVRIEIFGPPTEWADGDNWSQSDWNAAIWGGWKDTGLDWRDVTPESLNAQISWGADDPVGCLSIAAAGSWQIQTYDPKRLLDPGNSASPLVAWLKPGGFCRIMFNNEVVRHGFIDEITFDMATLQGSIRASDGISLLVKAKVPAGLMHAPDAPLTLRARARWILRQANVAYIKVEDDPTNMVDNPSFENGLSPWMLNGVVAAGSGVILMPDSPDGAHIIRLIAAPPNAYPKYMSPRFTPQAGKTYRLGAWGRRTAGTTAVVAILNTRLAGGSATGVITLQYDKTTWEYQSALWTAPADVTDLTMEIGLQLNNNPPNATGEFDNVLLEDISGEPDPVVGLPLDNEASAWQQINACALDALHACWLDRHGVLRFRYFGNPYASGVNIGYAPDPLYAIPIDTLETKVSLEGIYNHVRAANDIWVNPGYGDSKNQQAIDIYGDLLYTRERGNPDAGDWSTLVMQDRSQSEARYGIGTMRFQREQDLIAVLDLGMVYSVALNATSPDNDSADVSEIVTVLGGRIEANTESGWSGGLVTYKPSQPLSRPHKPLYMARYDVTKNRQLYVIKGNTGGGESPTPFDLRLRNNDDPPGSKTTRLLFDCDPIDWTGITKIIRVLFCMFNPPHDHDPSARTEDLRAFHMLEILSDWDENAVWPGPSYVVEYFGDIEPHIGWEQEGILNIFERWRTGVTTQRGIAMQPWHVDPTKLQDAWGNEQHVQVNNRTVDSRPYFLMYYER
jgi:hypothetical protein